jgi:hypothetical protein
MEGGFLVEGLYSVLFIVAVVGSIILGGYLALTYVKTNEPPKKPEPKPKPMPMPEPTMSQGWGIGPWGEDPYSGYVPDAPKKDAPLPTPYVEQESFKPVLTLLDAKYDHVSRFIQLKYKILPSGSVPPTKTFNVAFTVMENGKSTVDFPEEEPLSASEMTGLQQVSLIPVTNVSATPTKLSVSGQMQFRENGTVNHGFIGVPVIIDVVI